MIDEYELAVEQRNKVDNAIKGLVLTLYSWGGKGISPWDTNLVSKIRSSLAKIFAEEDVMTEAEFYPELPEHSKKFLVGDSVLLDALLGAIESLDADQLAELAGKYIGGKCTFDGMRYKFTANENYKGAFDKKLEDK